MIVMMGYIHLKPCDIPEFLAVLETIAAGTQAERGCLFYGVPWKTPPSERMLFVRRWRDHDTLQLI